MLDGLVGLQRLPGTCWRNLKGPGVLGQGLLKYRWILNLVVKDPWPRPPCCCGGQMAYSEFQTPACHSSPSPCPVVCVLSLRRVKAQRHLQVLVLGRKEQPWPQPHLRDPFAWEMGSFAWVSTEPKKEIGLMSPRSPVPDPIVSVHRH